MRHQRVGRKLSLKRGQRRSFVKILIHNLIMKNRIETTEARAKTIKPKVEKLVTIAKKNNLAALRLLQSRLAQATKALSVQRLSCTSVFDGWNDLSQNAYTTQNLVLAYPSYEQQQAWDLHAPSSETSGNRLLQNHLAYVS